MIFSSSGGANDYLDWALIKFTSIDSGLTSRDLIKILVGLFKHSAVSEQLLQLRIAAPADAPVQLVKDGVAFHGVLSDAPIHIRLPSGSEMIKVFEVEMSDFVFGRPYWP